MTKPSEQLGGIGLGMTQPLLAGPAKPMVCELMVVEFPLAEFKELPAFRQIGGIVLVGKFRPSVALFQLSELVAEVTLTFDLHRKLPLNYP